MYQPHTDVKCNQQNNNIILYLCKSYRYNDSSSGTKSLANNKYAYSSNNVSFCISTDNVSNARSSENSLKTPQLPLSRKTSTESQQSNVSYKSKGRLGVFSFNFLHTGLNAQLNPTQSDPQLAGIFVNKTEVFNEADFPARSSTDSSSNPNLRVSSSSYLYENINFDKAHEKANANQNTQTNNYSQVVSDLKITLKKRLPKPPPKPKDISKKHYDAFSLPRKKSAVGPDADIIDGLRKSEIYSTYHKPDDRPESDCTEMYARKSQMSFTTNTNENRDSDIYYRKSKTSEIYENHNKKYDVSKVYENVKLDQTNVPDDVKVKMSDILGLGGYVAMDRKETKRRKSASDLVNNDSKLNNYTSMHRIKRINWSNRNRYSSKPNTESCHIKGDEGCIFARMDSMYIYSINPDCETGNAPPFLRTKEKTDPLPCFCPKNAWGTQKEKEIFFSCEDIYVNVCSMNECSGGIIDANHVDDPIFRDILDSTRVDDDNDNVSYIIEKFENVDDNDDTDNKSSSSLFRKKIQQLKGFLTDWS